MTKKKSRDSDSSGEGTGRGRRGKETDGGLFFMYIFCFFFKTWRGEWKAIKIICELKVVCVVFSQGQYC